MRWNSEFPVQGLRENYLLIRRPQARSPRLALFGLRIMSDTANKALVLCREYDCLMQKVKRLTGSIGDCLAACPRSEDNEGKSTKKGLPFTHLSEAFEMTYSDGDDDVVYPSEEDKVEILSVCPHCAAAYEHVKERKAAKKRLGAVKRAIRLIGRERK